MEEIIKKEEQLIEKRKDKIKNWLKDPHNLIVALLGAFVLVVYLYYFFKLGNQPTWWDEGDYLSIATIWANHMPDPEWLGNLLIMRPPVIPFVWSIMLRLGLGEFSMRFFTELLPALISIYLVYLLGKGMFNKNVGIIAASAISFNWVFMFYSFRLLTDSPTLMFAALSLYLFWVIYEKPFLESGKENLVYLCLAVVSGILAFETRYAAGTVIFSVAVYVLISRNMQLFKSKSMWIALIAGILMLMPLFAYYYVHTQNIFPALEFYQGAESGAASRAFSWEVINTRVPNFLGQFGLIAFIFGFVLLLEFLLSFDLLVKRKNFSDNRLLFCFLGVIIPIAYFIFGIRGIDERYLVSVSPLIFVTLAYGIDFISLKISELLNKKYIHIALIFIVAIFLIYTQLSMASSFINNKYGSYGPIQEAGLWLKQNTPESAKIITASTVQVLYYSGRQTYVIGGNYTGLEKCFDVNGVMTNNESCLRGTEAAFNKKVANIKPDYMIVHIFEPVFTPQWAYDYPQRYNLTFVKSFGSYNNGPALLLYKF